MSFKRRRRAPSQRRKTEWEGFNVMFPKDGTVQVGSIYSAWAKYPSASLDASNITFPIDYVTDVDDTLVHTTVQYGCVMPKSPEWDSLVLGPVMLGVGLYAFNTLQPGLYDNNVFHPGDDGRPADPAFNWGTDWIWRDTRMVGTNQAPSLQDWWFLGMLDRNQQISKAQRKLPSQTGILWVMSLRSNLSPDEGHPIFFSGFFDVRMLLKKH